ncbi:hypothetical protein EV191_110193 [Tamaricihabitans halophyticus]|uniref:DUF4352 domain-containing protein n=1 Tax=Tamaricihabitans halophyticus TaxID=1262583 RepID=A0A4R2QHA5_9PSEU|nr:hypothetical protein [Tamaricihabitans halophyticus]TCP48633.1 hypothetical protein EV191_110193 [Tamaricihabitans halophyticus]
MLGAAAIAASACGSGDDEQDSAAPTTAETSASEPSEEPADAGTAGDAELTEPGTELSVGDRAVLPFEEGAIGITVTSIEEGDTEGFRADNADNPDAAKIIPYYIKYTVENVDGSDFGNTSVPRLGGITADGGTTGTVLTGSLGDCEQVRPDEDFTEVGATFETCNLQGGQEGREVGGVKFDEDDYRDDPVVWMK